jgi:hypothetical protein
VLVTTVVEMMSGSRRGAEGGWGGGRVPYVVARGIDLEMLLLEAVKAVVLCTMPHPVLSAGLIALVNDDIFSCFLLCSM